MAEKSRASFELATPARSAEPSHRSTFAINWRGADLPPLLPHTIAQASSIQSHRMERVSRGPMMSRIPNFSAVRNGGLPPVAVTYSVDNWIDNSRRWRKRWHCSQCPPKQQGWLPRRTARNTVWPKRPCVKAKSATPGNFGTTWRQCRQTNYRGSSISRLRASTSRPDT